VVVTVKSVTLVRFSALVDDVSIVLRARLTGLGTSPFSTLD
jgi:hypothetical protein